MYGLGPGLESGPPGIILKAPASVRRPPRAMARPEPPADPAAPEAAPEESAAAETAAGNAAPEAAPPDELEALRAALAASEDARLRARAELQNAQRRHAREREAAARYRVEPLARELLDIADALDEAAAVRDAAPAALREGQELIRRRLAGILEKFGVEALDPAGEAFDPQLHEALAAQPDAAAAPGTVLAVLRRGYRLHDRLLRPARVVVAAAPAEDGGDAGEAPAEPPEEGASGAP